MPLIELALPDNWNEIIDAGKYMDVIHLLNTPYENESDARWAMLQMLTGVNGFDLGIQLGATTPVSRKKAAEKIDWYDAMEIAENVFPALDFIFSNKRFYKNPVKQFTHNDITYQGPDDKLLNQTGAEWTISHHAQILYSQAPKSPEGDLNTKYLRTIIAANWHAMNEAGDRGVLNEHTMDEKGFDTLPEELVKGIYMWYLHCENWWNEKYSKLYEDEGKGKPAKGTDVWDLMFELSGCSIDARFNEVNTRTRQQIFMALQKLEQNRQRVEEQSSKS